MARYLSDEWFAAVDAALGPEPGGNGPDTLVVQQRVDEGPDGTVLWHVTIDGSSTSVHQGRHPSPTVTFTQDYATAAAVTRGDLSAQEAFMTGRITLGGDAGALIRAAPALADLGDALSQVRADTTY